MPQPSRCRRRRSNSSGNGEIVSDDADREAAVGQRRPDGLVAADVAGHHDHRAPAGAPLRDDLVHARRIDGGDQLLERLGRQPHQLDDVARVLAVRPQREPPDARMVGGQPEDMPEVRVREPPLRRPQEIARLGRGADDRPRRPAGARGRGRPRLPCSRRWPSVRRCGVRIPGGAGAAPPASPLAHRAAAALDFASPARALASLRDTSLPTSVSLSSPRMNASTRWCAMSSWIWSGGLFMK